MLPEGGALAECTGSGTKMTNKHICYYESENGIMYMNTISQDNETWQPGGILIVC